MSQLGADDVEVDRLATTFDATAGRLGASEQSITTAVSSVTWLGPDADAFRARWKTGMRAQLTTASDRLTVLATDLRKQAAAQRTTSDGADVPSTSWLETAEQWLAEQLETMREVRDMDRWAEDLGRQMIRDMAGQPDKAQLEWWKNLTAEQRQALLRIDPGALYALDGLPPEVRADARVAFIEAMREDIEISSTEDKIAGELNVAVVHLGVEGTAGIVQMADGTWRVDIALDGELGANLGKGEGHAGLGAGVAQSYEFGSQADAEAFVAGLYDKLTPDPDWGIFVNPGSIVTDTVEDVADYLGDHSDVRTKFEGELRIDAGAELKLGAFDVSFDGELGGRYDFDTHESTAFVTTTFSGELAVPSVAPTDGAGETGKIALSADVEASVKFDDAGNISEVALQGTLDGQASVGIEQFFGGTNATSKVPESFNLALEGGGQVTFDATLDLTDPIVQQEVATLLNGDYSLQQLQSVLAESELQIQVNATGSSSDGFDAGIAKLEISTSTTDNLVTWVKPPGGDLTHVTETELNGGPR